MNRLEDKIKTMIVDRLLLKVNPLSIADDEDLLKAYDIDSRGLMELVIGVEEHFGIELGDEEFSLRRFSSVKGIADAIRPKMISE